MDDWVHVESAGGDSIWKDAMARPHALIDVDFGVELLMAFLALPDGIRQWNSWCRELFEANILYPSGRDGEREPPLMAGISIAAAAVTGRDLRGIELHWAHCGRVVFDGSDLSMADPADPGSYSTLGDAAGCSFRGCNLQGCHIGLEITGTDFRGASGEPVFEPTCWYDPTRPPLGLPAAVLSAIATEPSEAAKRLHARPVDCRARLILMKARR